MGRYVDLSDEIKAYDPTLVEGDYVLLKDKNRYLIIEIDAKIIFILEDQESGRYFLHMLKQYKTPLKAIDRIKKMCKIK